MSSSKLRRQIAWEAARLMYQRQESEYFRAKQKAARRIVRQWVPPSDLPSNSEIQAQVQALARMHEGEQRTERLQDMRLLALSTMRLLRRFRPRLIGSVLTGHVRQGSDIDIHVFSDSIEHITHVLENEGCVFDVQRKLVRKHGEHQVYVHIHIQETFPIELTVYPSDKAHYVFKSSITGKAMERASIAELERFMMDHYPDLDMEAAMLDVQEKVDRFQVYQSLLLPLEYVKQSPKYHPEGDALYHSLQVFDLACDELPYDEEFLLAALLHDVGKAIDPRDHVAAGLEALGGFITPRTAWFIEHHMLAHQVLDGTIGSRAKRRMQQSEDYDDLLSLCECDRSGRVAGVEAPELEEALDYIRDLAVTFG